MFRSAGVSASARPFEISGIALTMPPLPVPVPTPAPVRLNHSSRVNTDAPSSVVPAAAPNDTYWFDPLSWTPALPAARVPLGIGPMAAMTSSPICRAASTRRYRGGRG